MNEISKRTAVFNSDFKVRTEENKKIIEGYFVVYNQRTELWPGVLEEISENSLIESLASNDVRCLFNHDTNIVLGRTGNGTLKLKSDEKGLYGVVEINENDREAVDIYARIERGDINACSFGFYPIKESREDLENGDVCYIVEKAKIFEVSPVTFPAYPTTEIAARKKDFEMDQKREQEKRDFNIRKQKLKEKYVNEQRNRI